MKNIMILTFLLIFAVGCKTETIEEVPVQEPIELEAMYQEKEFKEICCRL